MPCHALMQSTNLLELAGCSIEPDDAPAVLTCHGLWQLLIVLCFIPWLALCLLQKHALTDARQAVQNSDLLVPDVLDSICWPDPCVHCQ